MLCPCSYHIIIIILHGVEEGSHVYQYDSKNIPQHRAFFFFFFFSNNVPDSSPTPLIIYIQLIKYFQSYISV